MGGFVVGRTLALSIAFASVLHAAALSAEIKTLSARDGRITIVITGDISPGDADAFKALVKQANDGGKLVGNLRLNSTGGNLLEGVKLAEAVRYAKLSTNVGKKAICASACFLVFAAGSSKFVSYGAQIGVHGASDQSGNETMGSNAATVSMAKIAKELGVPPAIIGRMVVTPPTEVVWLSPQDLQSMGTTMVGKPDQVASGIQSGDSPPQQTSPSEPFNIQPDARANKSTPISWDEFFKGALLTSASQNEGKPRFFRTCQPEIKSCVSGVSFLHKGREMFARITRDINEHLIQREICEINSTYDVRKCVDWDTNTFHSDMKDSKGNWYKVSEE